MHVKLSKVCLVLSMTLCSIGLTSVLYAQEELQIAKAPDAMHAKNVQLRPLLKNGKPIFPIGAYGIPAGCTVSELHSAGWNTVLLNMGDKDFKQTVQDCGNSGLSVIANMTVSVYGKDQAAVREFIKGCRDYPATLGYYIADEPENNFYTSDGYKAALKARPGLSLDDYIIESLSWVNKTAKELDPPRYTFMCIAWWSDYMNLQRLCDVNMPNSYPTNNTKMEFEGSQAEILYDARTAAEAALAHGGLGYVYTPYGLDNNQNIETYRTPTIREYRYSVYAPITAGAMGMISWAGYRCTKPYAEKVIFPVTRELHTLTPFLVGKWYDEKLKCTPSDSSTSLLKEYKLPAVSGCLRRAADGKYMLLAVNNTDSAVNATFTLGLKGLPNSCQSFFDSKRVTFDKGGVVQTTLPAYGVVAYIFSTKN